ncbi:hypothetical protein AGMMS49525_15450 [Bacteroidia bacterium]|nr:hypothetical protein AGMMS49525_15450 [Bacteroidia bacterium]
MINKFQKDAKYFIVVLFMLFTISIYAQTGVTMTVKYEVAMFEKSTAISKEILRIEKGKSVKAFEKTNGYYRVEYNGITGYIDEIWLQNSTTTQTTSSNTNVNKSVYSQNKDEIQYTPASPKPSFEDMLKGVRTAVYFSTPKINGYISYLKEMGFETVVNLEKAEDVLNYRLKKDIVLVLPNGVDGDNYEIVFNYPSLNYEWHLSSRFTSNDYSKYRYDFDDITYEIFRRAYPYKKPAYDRRYELHFAKRKTGWNKNLIINDFKENGLKPVEGIYENSSGMNQAKYNVAVKYMNGTLRLIYLSGANNPTDWDEGEVKATLTPTATPNFYKANWIMGNKTENNDCYISFEQGVMNVISSDKTKDLYVKMYPAVGDNIASTPNGASGSGTGFAITSNGLIATNYHVVEDAKTINVRGINGNFSQTYSAQVMLTDKNNDLAILKITANLGTIPYVIKSEIASVGTEIFVLGYPLRATMGDEVKLTNGIVSSRTGFQGDVTSYQISVPIQPGNSGGPLFNGKGDIVGIINAKHTQAENASYAIKTSYLLNLLNLLDTPPTLQKISTLAGKSLSQQTESVKKFVYIIEVN